MTVLCGYGDIFVSMSLQKCQFVPIDIEKFTPQTTFASRRQFEASWVNFSKVWLPQCNTSFIRAK